jgi:hypothetical protein
MSIDDTIRKKHEANMVIADARSTISLAKIRCLPFDELLTRLRNIFTDTSADEVILTICEVSRDSRQDRQLASAVRQLAAKADTLNSREKARYDRRLKSLLATLPLAVARPIAMDFLDHPRKSRREAGFERLELDTIDDQATINFVSRYMATGDHRFLQALLRHPLRLETVDPSFLVLQFAGDEYWQMRVVESTLRTAFSAGVAFSKTHPRLFIWASGRLKDERLLPLIRESFRTSNDKVALLGIVAWAFGKLKAYDELTKLEPFLSELEEQNRIDWDTFGKELPGG